MSKDNNANDNVTTLRPIKPCPICKKNSVRSYYPFCSLRCENIDLNRWLSGAYVIEGEDGDAAEGGEESEQI